MILSHEHKFIYIKTYKTGSTSIEAALSRACGDKDVITEASEELRGFRQRAAQNYRLDHPAVPRRPLLKRLLGRPERHYHPSIGYYEHMPAWRVRLYAGEAIWKRYFKFTFERHPWDRQVSWYHYKTKNLNADQKPSFDRFNRDRRRAFVENWGLYTMDDAIVVDHVGRYEDLASEFASILAHVGLDGRVELPAANVSRGRSRNYSTYYDEASKALVADWYSAEIRHFGYSF